MHAPQLPIEETLMNQNSPLLQKGLVTLMVDVLRRWNPTHPVLNEVKPTQVLRKKARREPHIKSGSDIATENRASKDKCLGVLIDGEDIEKRIAEGSNWHALGMKDSSEDDNTFDSTRLGS
jgi:hypothetical protein